MAMIEPENENNYQIQQIFLLYIIYTIESQQDTATD